MLFLCDSAKFRCAVGKCRMVAGRQGRTAVAVPGATRRLLNKSEVRRDGSPAAMPTLLVLTAILAALPPSSAWYHPASHPVHALFARDLSVALGSPRASRPPAVSPSSPASRVGRTVSDRRPPAHPRGTHPARLARRPPGRGAGRPHPQHLRSARDGRQPPVSPRGKPRRPHHLLEHVGVPWPGRRECAPPASPRLLIRCVSVDLGRPGRVRRDWIRRRAD